MKTQNSSSRSIPSRLLCIGSERKTPVGALREISFGGGCVNDTVMHLASPHMGFGGRGETAARAPTTANAALPPFRIKKSILQKGKADLSMRFGPYADKKVSSLRRFSKISRMRAPLPGPFRLFYGFGRRKLPHRLTKRTGKLFPRPSPRGRAFAPPSFSSCAVFLRATANRKILFSVSRFLSKRTQNGGYVCAVLRSLFYPTVRLFFGSVPFIYVPAPSRSTGSGYPYLYT